MLSLTFSLTLSPNIYKPTLWLIDFLFVCVQSVKVQLETLQVAHRAPTAAAPLEEPHSYTLTDTHTLEMNVENTENV